MAFNPFKVLKSLLINEENTLTPKQIEITPGGTSGTKTSIVSSQTTDKTLTLPDATDTLATETQVETVQANLDTHIADPTGAHAASAVSVTPSGNLASTDVQAALVELQTDIDGLAPAGNYITALTGDVVATGPGSVAATIQAGAVDNGKIAAGVDAAKIADGSVSNAEFQRLNGLTGDIQTQLDSKLSLPSGS